MRSYKRIFVISLSMNLCILLGIGVGSAQTQNQNSALQRGYRTGYSDGYMAGYRDTIDTVARDYARHNEYSQADRGYNKDYGSADDYRDGYTQGFETGYNTGYDRRSFEATLPVELKRRGATVSDPQGGKAEPTNDTTAETIADEPPPRATQTTQAAEAEEPAAPGAGATGTPVAEQSLPAPVILIPRETELILELQGDINTEQNREGDKFIAKVAAPSEIAGATIEGRISKVQKPGHIKRRSELLLTFDRIVLSDTRWSNISATLIEVMPVKGDNISRVDNEGTAIGQSSFKSDAVKVGAATGAGALTGAMIGGGVGAAVGAGVGAGFGVGAAVVQRGKHVRLNRNQQIRIRTAYETQIR
jgi:hypothetical protein